MTWDEWVDAVEWVDARYPHTVWPEETVKAYFTELSSLPVELVRQALDDLYRGGDYRHKPPTAAAVETRAVELGAITEHWAARRGDPSTGSDWPEWWRTRSAWCRKNVPELLMPLAASAYDVLGFQLRREPTAEEVRERVFARYGDGGRREEAA